MPSAVIAGYARSPFCFAMKGELVDVRPDELASSVISALIERSKIDPAEIEDLLMGCAFPEGEQGLNIARLTVFMAKLPHSVAATTINRFCGSSMQAIHSAAGAIMMGAGEAFICAGVESMSRVPMGGYNPMPNPALEARYPQAYIGMGITAENVAKQYGITRREQEAFAVQSQTKASVAQVVGKLREEIVPITTPHGVIDKDTCLRGNTTLDKLSELKPAFLDKGVVTAGTASPLTDGAAAVLVTSEDYARRNHLQILARIKSIAVAGCEPEIMGIGPVAATKKALARANLTIKDIDIVELNEAFASQSIACMRDLNIDMGRVNIDGGAIALGHPLGATGARIVGKAAQLLKREKKKYALATQCIGGGQGIATILEAME
ncbi:MAG: thiolase family protein [Bdellovibrionales bacterium]